MQAFRPTWQQHAHQHKQMLAGGTQIHWQCAHRAYGSWHGAGGHRTKHPKAGTTGSSSTLHACQDAETGKQLLHRASTPMLTACEHRRLSSHRRAAKRSETQGTCTQASSVLHAGTQLRPTRRFTALLCQASVCRCVKAEAGSRPADPLRVRQVLEKARALVGFWF